MSSNVKDIQTLLSKHQKDIAFLIGNGVNLHKNDAPPTFLNWNKLLQDLWALVYDDGSAGVCPKGVSVTEFYDLLELEAQYKKEPLKLQAHVCQLMQDWAPKPHHRQIIQKAIAMDVPVMTTNYEKTLHGAEGLQLHKIPDASFTHYYPWSSYYSTKELKLPNDGFGIWHVNGMIKYSNSIRLGLTHYMGSVERARDIIKKGGSKRLHAGNLEDWKGKKTWLDLFFKRSLFIVGLGLYENEVFLRWMLIERAIFFKKFPHLKKEGWYITKKSSTASEDEGRRYFLESLGIQYIEVEDYDDVYENVWK